MVGQANEAFSQPTQLFQTIGRPVAVHIHVMDYPVVADCCVPWYLVYACSQPCARPIRESRTSRLVSLEMPELLTMREMLDTTRQ